MEVQSLRNGFHDVRAEWIASQQRPHAEAAPKAEAPPIEDTLGQLEKVFQAFNTHLQFSVIKELDTVVVKVIDSKTDKVIKEIPPKELTQLHLKIRETIGLLFDQEI
jgi:flagellar protein FlaG